MRGSDHGGERPRGGSEHGGKATMGRKRLLRRPSTNLTHWGTVLGSKEGVYVPLGLCRRNPYNSGREKKGGSPYILSLRWMGC